MNEQVLEQVVIKKVTWRLIPFLVLTYFVCYLDRVNVGFAALTMNKDLGFTATIFGAGAGIFFLGYFLFEVPSNLALQKYGARFWIARIMISWGLLSAAMAMVQGKTSFIIVRFLLGAAEAGFFPGIILYLTYWFPARYRAAIVSRFMFAIPVSLLIGAPVSGLILNMNGVLGLAGWKWLFIFEGIPSVVLGFITYYYLTDSPAKAEWLEPNERQWLQAQLDHERASVESVRKFTLGQALLNPRVLVLGLVYFTLQSGIYGVNMWLPQIIKRFGNLTTLQIGLIAAIPFAAAAIGMLAWGHSSDKKFERKLHLTVAFLLGAFGLLGSALFSTNPVLTITLLSLSSIGLYAAMPVFWTVPPIFLTGTAAAGGIALINSIGNLGGFAGPFTVGWIKDATGNFIYGLVFLGLSVLIGGVVAYFCCQRVQASAPKAAAKSAGR
jgi:ACS family tartrate transporter-like MFS transporter